MRIIPNDAQDGSIVFYTDIISLHTDILLFYTDIISLHTDILLFYTDIA